MKGHREVAESRLDPTGRVIMISGANRGIGASIARRLYTDGYTLSLGARDPDGTSAVTEGMDPDRVLSCRYEAKDAATPADWVARTVDRFTRLDGLVCNAGVAHKVDFDNPDEAALDEMFAVNAKAPFRLIVAARGQLKASGAGRIVVVTSLAGLRHIRGSVGYAMSKHAAQALTNAARMHLWNDGIRVTAVSPGPVNTDMSRGSLNFKPEDMIPAGTIADVVALALGLPNNASVALVPVNAIAEPLL